MRRYRRRLEPRQPRCPNAASRHHPPTRRRRPRVPRRRPRPRPPPLRLEPGRRVNDRRPAASATASHPPRPSPPSPSSPSRFDSRGASRSDSRSDSATDASASPTNEEVPDRLLLMDHRRRRGGGGGGGAGGAMTCLHTGQHARFVISHGSMQSLWNACPQPSARNSSPLS